MFRDYIFPWLLAVLICGGLLFGMAFLLKPHGSERPSTEARAAAHSLPVIAPIAQPPAGAPPAEAGPAESEKVVRSGDRIYQLPPPAASRDADIAAYTALKRNCENATKDNRDGEYPALQQMACDRYAQFSASKGFNTSGPPATPAVAAPALVPAAPAVTAAPIAGLQVNAPQSAECPDLVREKEAINARMRKGYGEPEGNWLRSRIRFIDRRLWELQCRTP